MNLTNYSSEINALIDKLITASVDLGGKILGAIIIFIIGKLLVNWANKLFAKVLQKRKVDASIQSFLKSIVNITLLVLLFLAVIGQLGIDWGWGFDRAYGSSEPSGSHFHFVIGQQF